MKKVIGIMRCKKKIANSNILYSLLKRAGYSVEVISYEDINKEYIEKSKENADVLILEIDIDDIEKISKIEFNLDVIIDADMTLDKHEQEECLLKKTKLIETLKQNGLLVVNADNTNTIRLSSVSDKPIVMTYGLNGKSSVTLSSLDFDGDRTKFNLCLQRKLTTIYGSEIEQFEYPVETNLMDMEGLYTVIAFISTSLYLGVDIEDIAKNLFNIN